MSLILIIHCTLHFKHGLRKENNMAIIKGNLDRTGKPQNFLQRLAAELNWKRRSILGCYQQLYASSWYWVVRHPDYQDMAQERKEALVGIIADLDRAKKQLDSAQAKIAAFHNLPKWTPEATAKRLKPSRKRSENSELMDA